MSCRFAILILPVVLVAIRIPISATAAPVPKKSKLPEVYALLYVGSGINDKENAKRLDKVADVLRSLCGTRDKKDFHAESVQGTGVLRVWYTSGTLEKQAEIINMYVDRHMYGATRDRDSTEDVLKGQKRDLQQLLEKDPTNAQGIHNWKKNIKYTEEKLRGIPHLLERAVLPAMPTTAAPAAKKSKPPEVYALLYVGNGGKDKVNAKKIAKQVADLRDRRNDRFAKNLQVFEKDLHVEPLEGTAVLRVWCTNGPPEKQAEIINDTVDQFLAPIARWRKEKESDLQFQKRDLRELIAKDPTNAKKIKKREKDIKSMEEKLSNLPRLLERAADPEKRP